MEKQLIPKLRFPEFKKWEIKYLSDLLTFKNGVNASKEEYGSGFKFINVLDIVRNEFITHDKIIGSVNISEKEFENFKVEYGDILFQRSSETREEVGQATVYLDKKIASTYGGFVIRGKKKIEYDPYFMNSLLKTSHARNEITSKSGGSTRYNVGQETLSSVKIYTTELAEQQKIGLFLASVDKHITLLTQQKEKLELYKKGIMQQLFSQEIRFKDDNGNDFPDWEEKKMGEVCEKKSSNISANTIENITGNYKIYGAAGYLQNVDFYREEESYISIVKDGAGVGRILLCEAKSSVLGTLDVLKPKSDNNLEFLYSILSNISFTKYITGSTIPHIYFKDYSKEKIAIPCKDEQQKIASFLSAIDGQIEQVGKQIDITTSFKKGLLQQLFV